MGGTCGEGKQRFGAGVAVGRLHLEIMGAINLFSVCINTVEAYRLRPI